MLDSLLPPRSGPRGSETRLKKKTVEAPKRKKDARLWLVRDKTRSKCFRRSEERPAPADGYVVTPKTRKTPVFGVKDLRNSAKVH